MNTFTNTPTIWRAAELRGERRQVIKGLRGRKGVRKG